jgi:hypothetical protein
MSIILPALGIAFAAFCVWLTVRIINRRERWAKWTAIAIAIMVACAAYPVWWLCQPAPGVLYDDIGPKRR